MTTHNSYLDSQLVERIKQVATCQATHQFCWKKARVGRPHLGYRPNMSTDSCITCKHADCYTIVEYDENYYLSNSNMRNSFPDQSAQCTFQNMHTRTYRTKSSVNKFTYKQHQDKCNKTQCDNTLFLDYNHEETTNDTSYSHQVQARIVCPVFTNNNNNQDFETKASIKSEKKESLQARKKQLEGHIDKISSTNTHQRKCSYIHQITSSSNKCNIRTYCATLIVIIFALSHWQSSTTSVRCLDSFVKLHRNKIRQQGLTNTTTDFEPKHDEANDLATNKRNGNFNQDEEKLSKRQIPNECPTLKQRLSLVRPEANGGHKRAYCDCSPDLQGWHLTCFSNLTSLNIYKPVNIESLPLSQSNTHLAEPLPNQLHPAFRSPQLQRQQHAGREGANQLVKRSPTMGQDSDIVNIDEEDLEGFESSATREAQPSKELPRDNNQVAHGHNRKHSNGKLLRRNSINIRKTQQLPSSLSVGEDNSGDAAGSNFQNIPTLFSIKYIKNTMIEIDCDQASPLYKAAMFQGKFKRVVSKLV